MILWVFWFSFVAPKYPTIICMAADRLANLFLTSGLDVFRGRKLHFCGPIFTSQPRISFFSSPAAAFSGWFLQKNAQYRKIEITYRTIVVPNAGPKP